MNKALYRIRIKGDSDVLWRLFTDSKKIMGWGKRIVGWGLKDSDFDQFEGCSRRIFNSRKNRFLKLRLIENIDRKKGKREKYYKITPLGIAYLFQNQNLGENGFKRVCEYVIKNMQIEEDIIISTITNTTTQERRSQIINDLLQSNELKIPAINSMLKALSGIILQDNVGDGVVYFSVSLERDIFIPLYKFTLKNESVVMNYDPAGYSKESLSYPEFYNLVLGTIWEYFWFELVRSGPVKEIEELIHDSGVYREEIIEEFSNQCFDVLESAISGSTFNSAQMPAKFLRLYR